MAWELYSTGFIALSTAPARYGTRMSHNIRINKVSRRITRHTRQKKDRGWSPPFSQRLFDCDYSLLRVNLLTKLTNQDVRVVLKIPGDRPLFCHIW
jgi:hypothetical protein